MSVTDEMVDILCMQHGREIVNAYLHALKDKFEEDKDAMYDFIFTNYKKEYIEHHAANDAGFELPLDEFMKKNSGIVKFMTYSIVEKASAI